MASGQQFSGGEFFGDSCRHGGNSRGRHQRCSKERTKAERKGSAFHENQVEMGGVVFQGKIVVTSSEMQKAHANGGPLYEIRAVRLPREFLVFDTLGLEGIGAETAFLVFLVVFKVTFEPFHVCFAFEGEDVGANPVEEETIV